MPEIARIGATLPLAPGAYTLIVLPAADTKRSPAPSNASPLRLPSNVFEPVMTFVGAALPFAPGAYSVTAGCPKTFAT